MVYYDSYKYMKGIKENVQYFIVTIISIYFFFSLISSLFSVLFSLLIYLGCLKITITITYYLLYLDLTVNGPCEPLGEATNAHSPNLQFTFSNYMGGNNKSRRY